MKRIDHTGQFVSGYRMCGEIGSNSAGNCKKAFKAFGYKVIGAEKLLRDIENGKISPDKVENTIITIPSNELSRARGGSHCMTCPIEREEI